MPEQSMPQVFLLLLVLTHLIEGKPEHQPQRANNIVYSIRERQSSSSSPDTISHLESRSIKDGYPQHTGSGDVADIRITIKKESSENNKKKDSKGPTAGAVKGKCLFSFIV